MNGMNKLISLLRDNVYICGIGIEDEYYYKWDVHHMGQNEIKRTKFYVKDQLSTICFYMCLCGVTLMTF